MIGGAQAMKSPEFPGQNAIRERVAFAPPLVPDTTQVPVGSGLSTREIQRQQTADAQQAGLERQCLGLVVQPARAQLGQALHRPYIVFESQRAKQSFPKRLSPAGLARARLELRCLALQSHLRRLTQQVLKLCG